MFFVGLGVGSAVDVGLARFVGEPVATADGLGVVAPVSFDGRKDIVGMVALGDSVGRSAVTLGDSVGVNELGFPVGVTPLIDGFSVGKMETVGVRMKFGEGLLVARQIG